MAVNICMCGASAGYPHHPACPRPLFRGSKDGEQRWLIDFAANRKRLAAGLTAKKGSEE